VKCEAVLSASSYRAWASPVPCSACSPSLPPTHQAFLRHTSVTPNTLLFLRCPCRCRFLVIGWLCAIRRRRWTRRDWAAVAALASSATNAASFLDFVGLQYVGAGVGRLILFLYPTMVLTLSFFFLHKRPTRREVVALIMS